MERNTAGGMAGMGMFAELHRQLSHGILTREHLGRFLKGQNPFVAATDQVVEWQAFYREVFGLEPDFSSFQIPAGQDGFDRLIVVAKGISPQIAYKACVNLFTCWKLFGNSLDEVIDFSFQTRSAANRPYAIWVRNRVEADEELKSLSANDLTERGIPGINLAERLLYELIYFWETGGHLDIETITLCSGSLFKAGTVPVVYWNERYNWVHVDWDDNDSCDDNGSAHAENCLRSREVVS